jgi:hypothetical protein
VTKKKFYHKPLYSSLENCLKELKNICIDLKVKKLAMPMIGCGLDRLNWNLVQRIIDDVFENQKELEITIFKFE